MYKKLTLQKGGLPVGLIKGGKMDKEIIYIDKTDDKHANKDFFVEDGEVIPLHHKQREKFGNKYNIVGAGLSGKSYMAKKIANDYNYQNPKNDVILLSGVQRKKDQVYNCEDCQKIYKADKEDMVKNKKRLQDCKNCGYIKRLAIDDSILEEGNELRAEEFPNSLIIFDDIQKYPNPDVVKQLLKLRDNIMMTGRHDDIDVINCSQSLLQGKKSLEVNTNALNLICFPTGGTKY